MSSWGRTPKRESKALLQLKTAFITTACEHVRLSGGVSISKDTFALQTRAGRLEVTPYDDFIACRFDDVARARELFGVDHTHGGRLNPNSGKWNFGQGELFDRTVANRPAAEARVLAEFKAALAAIVVGGPVDPARTVTLATYLRGAS